MKHTYLDLNKMGLAPMSFHEMLETDGGLVWWKWVIAAVAVAVGAALFISGVGIGIVASCEAIGAGFGIWAVIEGNNPQG